MYYNDFQETKYMEPKWLELVKQLQSIAQAGLTYSKDIYDLERFESLREISVAIIAHHTESDKTVIRDLFAHETGYAPQNRYSVDGFQGQ